MDGLVYIVDFLGRSGFFVIIMLVYLLLWQAIYGGDHQVIEGYSLKAMIWYLIITEIVTLSTTNYYEEVSNAVKTGEIAYLLNKPYHYVLYAFSDHMGKISLRLMVNTVMGILIGFILVGSLATIKWWHLPFAFLGIVFGILINYFMNLALAMTAFWVEENVPFRWIFQKLVFTLGGMLLPLELFPAWLRGISEKLPFAYITYAPAKMTVAFDGGGFARMFMVQTAYLVLALTICFLIYKKGVKQLNVNGG